jgi:glutamate 5-kinase
MTSLHSNTLVLTTLTNHTVNVSSPGSALGTGGMITKLIAAELATSTGCTTVITLGSEPELIPTLIAQYENYKTTNDESVIKSGTFFVSKSTKLVDRKLWIKQLYVHGSIYVDLGTTPLHLII